MKLEGREWDEDLISDMFNEKDRELILSIYLSVSTLLRIHFSKRKSYREFIQSKPHTTLLKKQKEGGGMIITQLYLILESC